jgi:anti-anti-sigma factor
VGSLSVRQVSSHDGSVALIARGIVDDETVEEFERTLERVVGEAFERLVIDLTACQLASAGLGALIRLQRRLQNRAEAALLVATDVDLIWTLRVVGLTYWFRVCDTLEAALVEPLAPLVEV